MSYHSWAPAARPLVRWSLTVGLLGAVAAAGRLQAQESANSTIQLDPVVVTATRTPQPLDTVGSSVAVFTAQDFTREQIDSLVQVLAGSAAPVAVSGAPGAVASLFLRGADSDQTLFLVDGIRVNDADTPSQNFLGTLPLDNVASVEIVRGPQSMLYGGEAIGGVVAVESRRGNGPPTATVAISGGSFGTLSGRVSTQGAQGPWAWSAAMSALHTENDRTNNQFSRQSFALRLDRQITGTVAVGATLRGVRGAFGDPGDQFTNDPNNTDTEQNYLATVFATVKVSDIWSTKLIVGGQHRRLVSDSPAPNPPYFDPAETTVGKNDRAVLDWQNVITLAETNTLTAGANVERSQAVNTGFGNIDDSQTLYGLFAQDQWSPLARWHFTAGSRYDHYDTFGGQATGRATVAWDMTTGTKLRASFGTGFRAPGFLELYGHDTGYTGNPQLRPEHARGWDLGIDQDLGSRAQASVTWFQDNFRDLIDYDYDVYPSTPINLDHARTQGVEGAIKADLTAGWRVNLAYTYLEARNLDTGARLLRRPRHNVQATVTWQADRQWQLGAGAGYIAQNQDVDAQTFATVDTPDYLVARIFARYAPTARLAFTLRVENAFNKDYEPVDGYPAPGRGIFGGVEYKF